MTLQAAMVIKEAATVRGDDRIVREMSGPDAIAADLEAARYHRSCYAAFTDTRAIKKLLENHITDEDGQEEGDSPYRRAFQHIQSEVQREIVDNALSAAAVKMSDLRNHYVALLKEEGVDVPNYRTAHLKARLSSCFSDKIQFVRTSVTEPELVVAAAVPRDVLFRAACSSVETMVVQSDQFTEEEVNTEFDAAAVPRDVLFRAACSSVETMVVQSDQFTEEEVNTEFDAHDCEGLPYLQTSQELFNSAMFLRSVILSMTNTIPSVPRANDLVSDNVDAPVALYNFLLWVLGGCTEGTSCISIDQHVEASERCHCYAMSILQDLVHFAT